METGAFKLKNDKIKWRLKNSSKLKYMTNALWCNSQVLEVKNPFIFSIGKLSITYKTLNSDLQ